MSQRRPTSKKRRPDVVIRPSHPAWAGQSKYEEHAQHILLEEDAQAVVLIVLGGRKGAGMTFTRTLDSGVSVKNVPNMLRDVANAIESESGRRGGGVAG